MIQLVVAAVLLVCGAVSGYFTYWRFTFEGHALSHAGTMEALAHVWMGEMVMLSLVALIAIGVMWHIGLSGLRLYRITVVIFWVALACWVIPSVIETVLVLQSKYSPL